MAYIGKEEFSLPEREGKAGTELWPAWHYGVLLLYGQNRGLEILIKSFCIFVDHNYIVELEFKNAPLKTKNFILSREKN